MACAGTALGVYLLLSAVAFEQMKAALMYAAGNRMLEQGETDAALVHSRNDLC